MIVNIDATVDPMRITVDCECDDPTCDMRENFTLPQPCSQEDWQALLDWMEAHAEASLAQIEAEGEDESA